MDILLWHKILSPYELAVQELVLKFDHMKKEHRERGIYCPIENVTGRVKTISSILEKMQKKEIPLEQMEEQVEDIAGIRIICQFVEDIERVEKLIEARSDMKILCEKDYIRNQKESGYRSYHLIVDYRVETMYGPKDLRAEIQIRTLAMNFWATIEHSLQYKYKKNIPDHIREKLSAAADAIIVLDQEMSQVRSEIMDAQNSFQIQSRLVADILNTIQNLYNLANKREILKIQDEFYRIYQSENLEQLRRFQKELDLIAEGYRAQSC